jgi:hypothetical protein
MQDFCRALSRTRTVDPLLTMNDRATGRNPRQRFSPVWAVLEAVPFAGDCHGLRPLGSIKAPRLVAYVGYDAATGHQRRLERSLRQRWRRKNARWSDRVATTAVTMQRRLSASWAEGAAEVAARLVKRSIQGRPVRCGAARARGRSHREG